MTKYYYIDGQEIMINDLVVTPLERYAQVQFLLEPGSSLANAYSAPNGGIVLQFDDGDHQLWHSADEDMRFVRRFDHLRRSSTE